jgi:predicted nucleic acid-binding protein
MMNPKKIKQPLTQNQTTQEIENYLSHPKFHLISPTSHTATIYTSLLQKYPLKNPLQTFDLFLVATMLTHQINRLLTLNTKDFSFIKEITPIPLK